MTATRVAIFALAFGLFACPSAKATFSVFNTSGSSVSGNAVNASVSFTTSANEVQITLQNLQADPRTVAQNLSALIFTIDSGQHTASLITSSGLERTVNGNGSFTNGPTVAAGWVLSSVGSSIQLDVLSGPGPAGPAHTLLADPNASTGKYSNANASIAGNGPHNAFLTGPVTFDLSVPGVTAASKVSTVTFQFGTTDGSNQIALNHSSAIPEPASASVLIAGAALSLLRRRQG